MKTHINSLIALTVLAFAAVAAITLSPKPARAAGPWYVKTTGSDGNDCLSPVTACGTINGAIARATSGDTILVATGTYAGTGSEVVLLNKNISLSGGWNTSFTTQSGLSTIDGENTRRGITVYFDITASVTRFAVQNGSACGGGGIYNSGNYLVLDTAVVMSSTTKAAVNCGGVIDGGGGIKNGAGILDVSNSLIVSNTAPFGGGIVSYGTLSLDNSTVSGNTSDSNIDGGGGVYLFAGSASLNSVTISANMGANGQAVTMGYNTTMNLRNSLIAGNSPGDLACTVSMTSWGYNIIGNFIGCNLSLGAGDQTNVSPNLGPLQDNGGSTLTHALLIGSPAIDGGNPAGCAGSAGLLSTDQRGFPRVGRCDIGAFELQTYFTATKSVSPATALPNASLTYTITLSNPSASTVAGVSVTDTLPISITYTNSSLTATGGSYGFASGVITWTGALNATTTVDITFGATVNSNAAPGSTIVNSAAISEGGNILTRTASVHIPAPTSTPTPLPTPTRTPTPAPTPYRVYLPLVSRCTLSGISGHVTFNGTNAGSVSLDLRFYNGSAWSTMASTTTSSNGNYSFASAPSLSPGQRYYVRYLNSVDSSHLSSWSTRVLNSYSAGTCVQAGNFDTANISLVSPGPGATVPLPQNFQWTPRAATTSDSYELNLFDPSAAAPYWYTPPLGYVFGTTINSLPPGFSLLAQYGWYVGVYSPDGGYGLSYHYYPVKFSTAGSGPRRLAPANPNRSSRNDLPRSPTMSGPSR